MTTIALIDHGALPAVRMTRTDGAQAVVTLYGAHLISWQGADGVERLFCSARSALDGRRAIRGGVPVIFPQFAERGDGLRHGFARVSTWRLHDSGEQDGAVFAEFVLGPADLAPAHAAAWPHAFGLSLRVSLTATQLTLAFEVRNDGAAAFAFSSALHTYFLVDALDRVRIDGVQDATLQLNDKLDQIFYGIDGAIGLRHGAGALRLTQSGFTDAVVWNPGAADAAALADMEALEYQRFVCIEPALIAPFQLAPGALWRGVHTLSSIP